jgi:hypothetical protein
MMQEGQFPIESQVGLSGVIVSNFAKLAKANFGGITYTPSIYSTTRLFLMAKEKCKRLRRKCWLWKARALERHSPQNRVSRLGRIGALIFFIHHICGCLPNCDSLYNVSQYVEYHIESKCNIFGSGPTFL